MNRPSEEQGVITNNQPTFYFIGVTTQKSSIMKVFPVWMKVLGRDDVRIEGCDLKIHDSPDSYRQVVKQIKYDPLSLGALVTTHKIDLLMAARDMFEFLDPYAKITGEVSSISKYQGKLEGHAKDPISSGLSLDAIIGDGYFARTNGHVLCFGAGGTAIATFLHLANKKNTEDQPERFILVNRSQTRLDHARKMIEKLGTNIHVDYIQNSNPNVNDSILGELPEFSVVINATGMGKDTPGSMITIDGKFPMHSIVWEFNYRGKLDFMHQALTQSEERDVKVEDGWLYFIHGWTQVISQVLHINLTPELLDKLKKEAKSVRIS